MRRLDGRIDGDLNAAQQEALRDSFDALMEIEMARKQFAANLRLSRRDIDLGTSAGFSYGTDRDIYGSLGYPAFLSYSIFDSWYRRDPIAKRVINAPVDATWSPPPTISEDDDPKETTFEREITDLIKRTKLWRNIRRADRMCGIGQYSILFLGFAGDRALTEEPFGELAYIKPFPEGSARILEKVKDTRNPRFGEPELYDIDILDVGTETVHWSRVIHIVEDPFESDVLGMPRLECVFNYLIAMLQVVGGSAEAFWRVAFPGLAFLVDKEAQAGALTEFMEKVDKFVHQLQRYIRLRGMEVKQLDPKIADPKSTVDVLFQLISAGSEIPKRLISGSEMGERSSTQDRLNWSNRIGERKTDHGEEGIIRPLITRLIKFGAVTSPKEGEDAYTVNWPPTYLPDEKEEAETSRLRTQTVADYVRAGLESVWPRKTFFMDELGYTAEEVDAMDELLYEEEDEEKDFNDQYKQDMADDLDEEDRDQIEDENDKKAE